MEDSHVIPKVSIIVPVYNGEQYLTKCINSILDQTLSDFEVIIINDGSTDNSEHICRDYSLRDDRIKVISKSNGGLSSARNAGLRLAKGEYIGFVDSDDYVDKDMFGLLFQLAEDTQSDIAVCKLGREINGSIINKESKQFNVELNKIEALRHLFKGQLYRFSACNKLYKRKCFEGIFFPEGRIHEDLSTTYRVFARANKVIYTNFPGYVYVRRNESILTSTYNEKRLQAFIGWDEMISFIKDNFPTLIHEVIEAYCYWSIDNIYYILHQVKERKDRVDYLIFIRSYIWKYSKLVYNNSNLSFRHKYLITLLNTNIYFLVLIVRVKQYFKKGGAMFGSKN